MSSIIIASVADNKAPYNQEIVYLFRSLQDFGGELTKAEKRAYFIDAVDPEVREQLKELGVDVRMISLLP